ncbi:class I SAM-dependent methyltransferase [bacterium]|nr:class I SAM-dependent methyltransferase [bacterium]
MPEWTNETAEWYAKQYGEYETNRIAMDALAIPKQGIVVDIGCGTGAAIRHAATLSAAARFIGIDPVPRMIEIAHERLVGFPHADRIEFRLGSAEELPFEDHSADLIVAFDSFDHWEDKQKGLNEVRRVLERDGEVAFVKDQSVPGRAEDWEAFKRQLGTAGFRVQREENLAGTEVRCRLLVAEPA